MNKPLVVVIDRAEQPLSKQFTTVEAGVIGDQEMFKKETSK